MWVTPVAWQFVESLSVAPVLTPNALTGPQDPFTYGGGYLTQPRGESLGSASSDVTDSVDSPWESSSSLKKGLGVNWGGGGKNRKRKGREN